MTVFGTVSSDCDLPVNSTGIGLENLKELYTEGDDLVLEWKVEQEGSPTQTHRTRIERPVQEQSSQYITHYTSEGPDSLNIEGTLQFNLEKGTVPQKGQVGK